MKKTKKTKEKKEYDLKLHYLSKHEHYTEYPFVKDMTRQKSH